MSALTRTCRKCSAIFSGVKCGDCARTYNARRYAENKAKNAGRSHDELMETKKCSKCKAELPRDQYDLQIGNKSGLRSACKECRKTKDDEYRESNQQKTIAATRRWQAANAERVRATKSAWRETNRDAVLAVDRRHRKKAAEELQDSYVLRALRGSRGTVDAGLIEAKREQLQIHRLTKELNAALIEVAKGKPK